MVRRLSKRQLVLRNAATFVNATSRRARTCPPTHAPPDPLPGPGREGDAVPPTHDGRYFHVDFGAGAYVCTHCRTAPATRAHAFDILAPRCYVPLCDACDGGR